MLDRLQALLDRVNRRFGAVGSIIAVGFWLLIMLLAFRSMLFLH